MASHHPGHLPRELIGVIAAAVASDANDPRRTQTLASCMLVCRSFTSEFRTYLFDTLLVHDSFVGNIHARRDRLSAHSQMLEDQQGYQKLVRNVSIILKSERLYGNSVGNDSRFPSWLRGLTSVTSISIRTLGGPVIFSELERSSQEAILNLCSLPSVNRLIIEDIGNLPPQVFLDTLDVESLSFGNVIIDKSLQRARLTEDEVAQIRCSSPRLHIHLSRFPPGTEAARTLQALTPLLARVWKLSGRYNTINEVRFFNMCTIGGRETLRELDLTLAGELCLLVI
jgi:hypothetical protein